MGRCRRIGRHGTHEPVEMNGNAAGPSPRAPKEDEPKRQVRMKRPALGLDDTPRLEMTPGGGRTAVSDPVPVSLRSQAQVQTPPRVAARRGSALPRGLGARAHALAAEGLFRTPSALLTVPSALLTGFRHLRAWPLDVVCTLPTRGRRVARGRVWMGCRVPMRRTPRGWPRKDDEAVLRRPAQARTPTPPPGRPTNHRRGGGLVRRSRRRGAWRLRGVRWRRAS